MILNNISKPNSISSNNDLYEYNTYSYNTFNNMTKEANQIRNKYLDFSKINMDSTFNNPYLEFLVNGCKISLDKFDSKGDCINGWSVGKKSGPPNYLKDYIPPFGWIGIGLQVINLFDNGDNSWIGSSNSYGEWYIGYHGIKTKDSILGIINNGFRRGKHQQCQYCNNINPLSKNAYPKCDEGVYFSPNINVAKKYTNIISYSGINYRVVLMCRINPYKVRIATIYGEEYWIVNGDKLDELSETKKTDEVRPYRILLFIEK